MEYRFKEIKENLDLKQREVADAIHISRSAYANIESETANIKLKLLLTYCNTFRLSLDYVAKLTDENNIEHIKYIDKIDKSIMRTRLNELEIKNKKEAQEIAKYLGIDKTTYSHYKNVEDSTLIQTLMLKKLAERYKFSMDYLIGRSDI